MRFKTEKLKDPVVRNLFQLAMNETMDELFNQFDEMSKLRQDAIDRIDCELAGRIKAVAKNVLGMTPSCKFKRYAPLTSERLLELEALQASRHSN